MSTSPDISRSAALSQIAKDAPRYSSYKPLDANRREIRLLDMATESEYSMRHASLDEQPSYCALSYYWGPPGANKPATINGEVVEIRKTLFQFLKSLYRQFGCLTVWLDVICMNQRVVEEQSSQVAMIGDIHRQAKCVYSWLGRGDPDTNYAAAILTSGEDLASAYEGTLRMVEAGVEQMFLRRYWTRVWVLQECILNRETFVVCGDLTLGLGSLVQFAEEYTVDMSSTKPQQRQLVGANSTQPSKLQVHQVLRNLATARHRSDGSGDKPLLLELVANLAGLGCLENRDRAYGFRALATDGHRLQVDYHCTTFDILIQLLSMHNWSCFIRSVEAYQDASRVHSTSYNIGRWWGCILVDHFKFSDTLLRAAIVTASTMSLTAPHDEQSLQSARHDWLVLPLRGLPDSYNRSLRHAIENFAGQDVSEWPLVDELHTLYTMSKKPEGLRLCVDDTDTAMHERLGLDLQLVVEISKADGKGLSAVLFPRLARLATTMTPHTIQLFSNLDRDREAHALGHLLAALRAIGKRHLKVCRIARGVHISRQLPSLLAALQDRISDIDISLISKHGLENNLSQLRPCECTLPEQLIGPCSMPWGPGKLCHECWDVSENNVNP